MNIPEIIESIYNSEIPCRIEWMFDGGFTWSIQLNSQFPRIWKDNSIQGTQKTIIESDEHLLLRNNPLLEDDWIERGSNYVFSEAIKELADACCKHFPSSPFKKWYKPL